MRNNSQLVSEAIKVLNKGGVIAFPTDTVYGIGCNAFNEKAINRIYGLKKRKRNKPLILFVGKKSEIGKYAYIPTAAKSLIKNFLPGALTIVFRSRHKAPLIEYNSTISIRIPSAEPILTLLKQYNRPLATTSANIEGEKPAASHKDLKLTADFVIPGTAAQIPSTIVDVSSKCIKVLREGKIKSSQIYKVINTCHSERSEESLLS
jgi:L-threonylcarbamoyladenylate synthase